MAGLTVRDAAATTGWSARMLRYLDERGLVQPSRSAAGYRLYGAAELQRLRTLRRLLDAFGLAPSEVALADRLRRDPELARAINAWLDTPASPPAEAGTPQAWLAFEQRKHQELLRLAGAATPSHPFKESA